MKTMDMEQEEKALLYDLHQRLNDRGRCLSENDIHVGREALTDACSRWLMYWRRLLDANPSIDYLELSVGTANFLQNHNIRTISQLRCCTRKYLMQLGIRPNYWKDIQEALGTWDQQQKKLRR